jgi:hypothetical protein
MSEKFVAGIIFMILRARNVILFVKKLDHTDIVIIEN